MDSRRTRKRLVREFRGQRKPGPFQGRRWFTSLLQIGFLAAALVLSITVVVGATVPLPPARVPETTRVFGHDNRLVARLFIQNRQVVPLEEIPLPLRQAAVAVEDSRFYRHPGLDPVAVARALTRNIEARRVVEGGSTITQQLAKNLFLTPERTLNRKFHEVFLTIRLETVFDKDEILEKYLNTIYLGHGAYGVEAAAQVYFGKPASQLTLGESALMAGLIRNPENNSPYRNPERARNRRDLVLDLMTTQGFISPEEAATARVEAIRLSGLQAPNRLAPFFVDYVLNELRRLRPEIRMEDLFRGGYQIFTTLDVGMQEAANHALQEGMATAGETRDERGVLQPQGALVALDPQNGFVRAMIGGRDYEHSHLNRAVAEAGRPGRQPGSAFKPFLYTALVERGYTPIAQKRCERVGFPDGRGGEYVPEDYGDQPYHWRPLTIRESIALSDNVTSIRWAEEIGPRAVVETARRMGIEAAALQPTLPLVLGTYEVAPLEMARGYAPLANGGFRVTPVALLKAVDPQGRVIVEVEPPKPVRVIAPEVAYVVTDMMKSVLEWGTAVNLDNLLNRPAAGKTGTTDERKEAWFVGFTPELVAAVYVGHDRPKALPGYGSTLAGPVWANFMRTALAGEPLQDWPRPAEVVRVEVCKESGLLPPSWAVDRVTEVFVRGTEPVEGCPQPWQELLPPGWTTENLPDLLPRLFGPHWQQPPEAPEAPEADNGEVSGEDQPLPEPRPEPRDEGSQEDEQEPVQ